MPIPEEFKDQDARNTMVRPDAASPVVQFVADWLLLLLDKQENAM